MTYMNSHPGDGMYFIICDICGDKIRRHQAQQTYGTRGNFLVCHRCYEDPHPQDSTVVPRPPTKLKSLRPEVTDAFSYIDSAEEIETGQTSTPSGASPGIPTDLIAAPEGTDVVLTWMTDRMEMGASSLTGFKIERETPVGGGFSTLVSNTLSPARYYLDETTSASTQYNYKVSAINSQGTGTASTAAATTTEAS